MFIWAENASDNNDGTGTVLKELPNNTDARYKFLDWKRMREAQATTSNLLSVQINSPTSPWETLKSLAVNSEGTTSYILRPKINNVSYRLAVDVKLRDNVKYVTLRSTFVIRNDCLVGIEVQLFAAGTRNVRGTYRIGEPSTTKSFRLHAYLFSPTSCRHRICCPNLVCLRQLLPDPA
jgi:vacuolar protein sorting-associated protein 13A/C